MRSCRSWFTMAAATCLVGFAAAQEPKPATMGSIERKDPAFDALVPKDAAIEVLAGGFKWAEGPVWVKEGGYLLFSDIPNNRVCKWHPKDGLKENHLKPSGFTTGAKFDGKEPGANGLALDKNGMLILCQHGDRRIARLEKDGKFTTVADKFQGKRFNSPNDLTLDAKGRVYFSDPRYQGDEKREIDAESVYRIDPDGTVTLLLKDVRKPNGLVVSPDGKTLYVSDHNGEPGGGRKLVAYPLKADGSCGPRAELYDFGKGRGIDGMAVAADGTIVATAGTKAAAGVYFFDPAGKKLGFLPTPEDPNNCCFGGADRKTLYVTAGTSLYRIPLTLAGAPTAPKP